MPRKNRAATGILALAGFLLMSPLASRAGDRQFDAIVQRIQSHYQKRPMRFMGLASFVANRVRPAGIKNIKLAVFENLEASDHPPDADLDAFMQNVAGPEFRPFVRVHSRRDGEQTFVYAKELSQDFELLVVSLERDEACVVKMRVEPEEMSKWIENPPAMSRKTPARHGGGG